MIPADRLLALAGPVAAVVPEYHVEEADINVALDLGIGNCAVRAYAGGLILRHNYPNPDLYIIEFGFSPEHGGDHLGENGTYTRMGHAATRFTVPGSPPLILESYRDSGIEVIPPNDAHEGFTWMDLDDGYRAYLEESDCIDVLIEPDDILKNLLRRMPQPS